MTPEARRAQLLEATIPLLREHGATVTTAQVARAAGVAEGTLFRLFPDKQSLLEAAFVQALDPENVVDIMATLPDSACDTRDRLVTATSAVREHFRSALPMMHSAMLHGQSARAAMGVGDMFRRLLDSFTQLFAQEIAAGRLHGDAQALSRILVGLCQSAAWQDFFDRGQSPLTTEQLVTVVLHGCAVRSEQTE